jgi:Fanconi anemia group M protein
MKINHAVELAETQGKGALENYFDKIVKEGAVKGGSKASRDLVKDSRFQQARTFLYGMESDHPKLEKIIPVLKTQFLSKPDSRVIVFTHYRDMCDTMTQTLEKVEGFRPVRFVGQASKGEDIGLNQREQKEIIEKFQSGEHNILVSTSIAEEGLDIPSTDLVVFYEPVPSEIRTIQRRGRTGRRRAGKVIVFVTKNTRDEAYLYSSRKKEMQMRRELDSLRRRLRVRRGLPDLPAAPRAALTRLQMTDMMKPESPKEELSRTVSEKKGQRSLGHFPEKGNALVVSDRVEKTGLKDALAELGFAAEVQDIENADIIISKRVAIAFRTVQEFIEGISDGSMFSYLAKLKHGYLHPILIVQGKAEGEGIQAGNAAVYDALSSLLSEYHMPVLSTSDPEETASAVRSLFRQEEATQSSARGLQTTLDVPSRQMFLVQGLPNVSATLAQRLLERFGSVKGIADADVEELMKVDGIGRVIAEGIHTVLRKNFSQGKD